MVFVAQIIDIRFEIYFLGRDSARVMMDQLLPEFRMAVFQISEYPCIGNTDLDTRRFFGSRIHPCLAEITLVHFLGFGVQVTCSIRTGRDTVTAADAEVTFDQHPPVFL